ncbi:MAG: Hsp20/alpha crystallin family protein [Candidatus Bathyarchaeia archaeon]
MLWKPSSSHLGSTNTNQVMNALDEKSFQILVCLLKEKHAGIRKLADLIDATCDMEVLVRIREVINPKVQESTGKSLIIFEPCKLDPLTGEKITFSWWLNEELVDHAPSCKSLDLQEEKDTLTVIASIPLQEEDARVEVKDDFLIIAGKEYYQEVFLTSAVEGDVKKTVNNGVLEVVLKKKR